MKHLEELDIFRKYMHEMFIPQYSHYCFQDITTLLYTNKYYPKLGKVFSPYLFPSQIMTFEEYKNGRDTTSFGIAII